MQFTGKTPKPASARKHWQAPTLEKLPKLTDLTLASLGPDIDGVGNTGGGGGTVF